MYMLSNRENRVPVRTGLAGAATVQIALIALFTAVFLALSVNVFLPYEQDQGSKAAKIVYMVRSNTIFEPLSGPRFYKDSLFSLYYMISAIVYKAAGGNIFSVMNMLSVFMGVIFFSSLSMLLNKVIHTSYITIWAVFFSVPILTTTFLYGNEVAFSITFFVISLVFLSFSQTRLARFWSALFLSASVLCRADIILLVPFWVGWYLWIEGFSLSNKETIGGALEVLVSFALITILYWFIFIRRLEIPSLSFEYHTNLKLLVAYLVYPYNPTLVLLGAIGICYLILKKQRVVLFLFCLTLPFFFYLNNLSSPKYIISLAFFWGIPALMLLNKMSGTGKIFTFACIGVWYLISITPYGINGFRDGAALFIPTADGPVPSGSYLWFYEYSSEGFYSAKYKGEMESAQEMVRYISTKASSNVAMVGRFNDHFLITALAMSPYFTEIPVWMEKWNMDAFPERPGIRSIMPQRAYLSVNNMSAHVREKYTAFLADGRIRGIADATTENTVFPSVIEIGDAVPPNSDPDLVNRLLFIYDYYAGEGIVNTSIDPKINRPTYWVHTSTVVPGDAEPIYQDDEWKCYTRILPGSQIWVTELPVVYSSEQDPNE